MVRRTTKRVNITFTNLEGNQIKTLKEYYGIQTMTDLFRFLLAKESREIKIKK